MHTIHENFYHLSWHLFPVLEHYSHFSDQISFARSSSDSQLQRSVVDGSGRRRLSYKKLGCRPRPIFPTLLAFRHLSRLPRKQLLLNCSRRSRSERELISRLWNDWSKELVEARSRFATKKNKVAPFKESGTVQVRNDPSSCLFTCS